MATKLELDYTPPNDESEGEDQDDSKEIEDNDNKKQPVNNNVADILKRLQSSGALLKKPKQEYRCFTCDEDFRDWTSLETHLIEHVSLPSVVLTKLPSDDEDAPSGDEPWSDEDDDQPPPTQKTPQKIDISQIMNKTGIVIKNPAQKENNSHSALDKLSGLGLSIKKNLTPIKEEKPDIDKVDSNNDVMEKLGKLGGLKLKLKSDGGNKKSFSVVKGLKDFKTSDDEDEGSGNDDGKEEPEEESDGDPDKLSGGEQDSGDESMANNEDEIPLANKKIVNALKNLQGKQIQMKVEPKSPVKPMVPPAKNVQQPAKPPGRPAVKQTPKRGANLPLARHSPQPAAQGNLSATSTPERRESNEKINENVVVKQEVDTSDNQSSNTPLFSGQIKFERESPPLSSTASTPIITTVKSEPEGQITTSGAQPLFQDSTACPTATTPILPVTKTEDTGMTIIEINGDSNDEDDDCCVVSATPAQDVKPVIPKTEPPPYSLHAFSTSQPQYNSDSVLTSRLTGMSTEKQHAFDWNAPDSKPPIDMLGKSADDIFQSLLSSTKKENHLSLSDASEYISLDTLGPQHSCEVCNTRFTDISLLENHRRMTGHSQSLVIPSSASSNLMPYNPQSNILSSLLPVKQLAEQVGKLSTIGGSGPGFTHQQNVMINIQAYPGSGNVMGPPPPQYNSYPGQNVHPNYSQPSNMYGAQNQPTPGQYPGQHYMGQPAYGSQYQPPMSKPDYPGVQSPYSAASPLQGMQQAVYGQSQMGGMGPPGSSPNHLYVPASSPGGTMRSPSSSNVRIQDVQTFAPGQLGPVIGNSGQQVGQMGQMGQMGPPPVPNQSVGGQMPSPGPIRMAAGANMVGSRPRMPSTRGTRPSIRPGIQVHGHVRGAKPGVRMPMKRPAAMAGGPGQKRRNDMLLPGKHDNEDCQVMAMQKQREGLPMIHSVQGAKDKLNLGSQISVTKKTVNKEANAMANVLASRGISIKQKQKSRSPSPERPIPHIPNLGAGVSIKHTSKSSSFSIPEAKVGGGMLACKICKKMFMNQNSLAVHMSTAHPNTKVHMFKCDECPASYPKSLQLQHHRRVFHNATGPNRELGLPVVDMSQEDNLKRLSNLGIYSFIPLANREQADGCFGIPVLSVHNMQNGVVSGLQALGADGLLSLGPLKPLPNS